MREAPWCEAARAPPSERSGWRESASSSERCDDASQTAPHVLSSMPERKPMPRKPKPKTTKLMTVRVEMHNHEFIAL